MGAADCRGHLVVTPPCPHRLQGDPNQRRKAFQADELPAGREAPTVCTSDTQLVEPALGPAGD
jgi:hypothetical protein